jgi:hypothetical protein
MRKKIMGFMIAGIMVLVFGLTSTPARAKFIMDVGYYSPGFGKINDYFAETADWRDTDPKFESGMVYGLALEYEVNPHFQLRLEHSLFESQTSGSLWMDGGPSYWLAVYKLTITPVILYGTYKFSPFYIGAGVGSFPIIFMYTHTKYLYTSQGLVDISSVIGSVNDGAAGLVLMAGLKFGNKPTSLNLEARYVVDTKAKLELDWVDTEVDLSGLQLSLLLGFKF